MIDDAVTENVQAGMRTALGTLLIERGFLDAERLDEALRIGGETGERLGEVVVRLGWATEDDLARILAEQWHLRYVERSAISFDGDALRRMSHEDASRLEALPMQVNQDGALVVALAEPTDARLMTLRSLLGDRIDCVVVPKAAIDAGLRSGLLAKTGSPVVEAAANDDDDKELDVQQQNEEHEDREPVLSLVTPGVFESTAEDEPAAAPTSTDFDDVANTLTEALNSQLASLRTVVVDAQAMHQRDRLEIARLEDELARKDETIRERSETIGSMEQKLRELADSLAGTTESL